MTKNDVFKRFLKNPDVREQLEMTDAQVNKLDLYQPTGDKLLEVIKTAILGTEGTDSIDFSARRINQFLKNN
jgi:hypothetical protein